MGLSAVSSNHQIEIPTTVELESLCHIVTLIGILSYGFNKGQICATPKSASAMATVYTNGTFEIKPLEPSTRCTHFTKGGLILYS